MHSNLTVLLDQLDRYTSRVPLHALAELLREFVPDAEGLKPYRQFDAAHYQRNLLRGNSVYHALLICWRAGQRSPIHDHRGSNCAFRVLQGTATESTFARTPRGLVYPTGSREFHVDAICASQDADVHQVSNLHGDDDLVTLHLYSPPLLVMGQYSLQTEGVTEFLDPVFEFSLGSGI